MVFYSIKVNRQSKQTVNVEFSSKTIELGNNSVRLQLWDTAGQEKYQAVTKSYYRKSLGVIIVFDITRMESFLHISNWLNMAKTNADPNATILVVGNKKDLKDERVVSTTEAAKFCQENDIMYLECSAFLGDGVDEIFSTASKNILSKVDSGRIVLDDGKNITNKVTVVKPIENDNKQYCSYC